MPHMLKGKLDGLVPAVRAGARLLLPPTLRYCLAVAAQRYPRYFLRACNSFDELYALCMLVVERHYLRSRGGSFTENFYGLKREKALSTEIPRANIAAPEIVKDALKLSTADVWRNLAVMVGVPYLKRKLDEAYEINAPRALLGVAYTRMPPTRRINAAYYFSVLAFNLAYLFDNTKFHSPFMWLIGTRVRRMVAADYRAIDALTSKAPGGQPPAGGPSYRPLGPWDFAQQLSRKAAENVELPPPIIAGLLSDKKAKKLAGSSNAAREATEGDATDSGETEGSPSSAGPDPDKAPIATPSMLPILTVPTPVDTSLCAICEGDIATATACQTGVVYCYTCIHRWIEGVHPKQEEFMVDRVGKWDSGKGRCAVTGRRVLGGTEGLRRIML
ncbi:unnamed protein product [Parascedosporium putredinis]|uniref:Peroxisome assembly protein 12 n=1 Tax=Parascedosporium putredinis TaxID=1442378 RepID=A0A9P1GUK1_9PEZI|nr:unnamed protein product [Parascedosporium putredinis]CAI7987662.1 unnamed protein product [Parascedosporium putredinis]